ncbi:Hypothetical protein PHPALM_3710 [Phytophthora palmivora]|uniref:Uncharacterized protein n=1 Tax=Phytophthora palmivora TaxID=4796 RepID=A0A2P4YLW0_9STRA|nr:Hypothetical protein PHPALM_3710 [Phytophthora palmivora]
MSMNHPIPTCWPAEVYDYERKTITDVAVGGIDLRKGNWIHCKWCNSTLKTTSFSLITWRSHQRRQTHRAREKEFLENNLQLPIVSCSSQSSVHSSAPTLKDTQATLPGIQSSQDHESLVLVRRDLQNNKKHQARYERDVNNVINAMTTLVTDQQSDLDSLQHQVQDLTRQIQGLKKEIEILRRKERQQKSRKEVVTTSFSSHRIPGSHVIGLKTKSDLCNGERFKIPRKTRSNNTAIKRNSMTDMDLFEKRFRLT